jgi:hypothetical protein
VHLVQRLDRLREVLEGLRKVFVRVNPESLEPLLPKFEAIGRAYVGMMEQYSDEQLQLICEYMEKVSQFSERELANLIRANRAQ